MNTDPFAWLEHDADLEWSRRDIDGHWLLIPRAVFARRSDMADDGNLVETFLAWAKTPRNGRRYCLAWDTVQSADADLLLLRYDT